MPSCIPTVSSQRFTQGPRKVSSADMSNMLSMAHNRPATLYFKIEHDLTTCHSDCSRQHCAICRAAKLDQLNLYRLLCSSTWHNST